MERRPLPDFLVIGAPKAGTTALHAALAEHPQLYAAPVKEPKYFLTPDRRPRRSEHRGPGDAHSRREWIWRRDRYEALFRDAPPGALRFESTPFYLWSRPSHLRIAQTLGPEAKLVAIIRDPIDRAFSNWTHLRADGLEPEADFLTACRAESTRARAGWAPFWRYLELGRYGTQLAHLFQVVDPNQVRVLRYRQLIDEPQFTLDQLCSFLGVDTGVLSALPEANVGRWAHEGTANRALRRAVRAGAHLGSYLHPRLWRAAERRLLATMQRGGHERPRLQPEERAQLVQHFADDNATLGQLLGADYSDWLSTEGRGMYTVRRS
ncbi:MAG TPA: sulfotransferase [Jatrophihabitantaceae bacterium]|jgi:hypothetical protein